MSEWALAFLSWPRSSWSQKFSRALRKSRAWFAVALTIRLVPSSCWSFLLLIPPANCDKYILSTARRSTLDSCLVLAFFTERNKSGFHKAGHNTILCYMPYWMIKHLVLIKIGYLYKYFLLLHLGSFNRFLIGEESIFFSCFRSWIWIGFLSLFDWFRPILTYFWSLLNWIQPICDWIGPIFEKMIKKMT